ncbi:MAG TPA: phosphoribosylformylglycinamidine cyclo-ligase [Verrucomicrobiae bacterium]|nr:phosphoribosylformylglycinamidine cyclo-ligase [Verrucomicrobiae bacterium]
MSGAASGPVRYADAGVDRGAAGGLVPRLAALARTTQGPQVLGGIGGFAGCFQLDPHAHREPVLVSSTDGVGTKVKVAVATGRHRGIGHDLVNHCVNDVLTTGAEPLFFLDYFATGRLDGSILLELVAGMTEACAAAGCALLGGETAEMPGVYGIGDYDLAGFLVGVAERDAMLGPERVRAGDICLGLPSSGLHTNGYALVRHLLGQRDLGYDVVLAGCDRPIGELLLTPHRSYLEALRALRRVGEVHAVAHITGGGIPENLPRVIPEGLCADIDAARVPVPTLFRALAELGPVAEAECWATFNMGVGMICIVPEATVEAVAAAGTASGPGLDLAGLPVLRLGRVGVARGPDRVRLHLDGEGPT